MRFSTRQVLFAALTLFSAVASDCTVDSDCPDCTGFAIKICIPGANFDGGGLCQCSGQ
ncbi:hypothetical protein HYFRA_00004774 [Hymenoscyphus fraxineus]|uniref:Uncharacterized protein n=1 Tax=Hymenoscyphus fraxineus TaxID=746836 RepID=A0A9N9KPB7_9HELO|nr:hypothetical protein HYFRA_00004774 [Hymenoscyphus fraxineus]